MTKLMLILTLLAAHAAFASSPASGTLKNQVHSVLWSGTVNGAAAPTGAVPECAAVACDSFELDIDLPNGTFVEKPGGVEIAIRWNTYGDNLLMFVYQGSTLVAASAGIISTAQSVLLPNAANAHYTVYIAFDPSSPDQAIPYEGLSQVQYPPKPHPLRPLLPDLISLPQRNVKIATPPPIFFDTTVPGSSCFLTEIVEDGAQTCLRFDQVFANIGEGVLQMRFALPVNPADTSKNVFQRIFQSDSNADFTDRLAGTWEFHVSHQHYHFNAFGLSRLWSATPDGIRVGAAPIRSGRKVSFCIADTEIAKWDQKGVGPRTYNAPDCLFPVPSQSTPEFNFLVQGITAGWADVYDWLLPDQYIEVTGVPDGFHILETIANPDKAILEADYSNNCGSVLIQLSNMGTSNQSAALVRTGPHVQCHSNPFHGRIYSFEQSAAQTLPECFRHRFGFRVHQQLAGRDDVFS